MSHMNNTEILKRATKVEFNTRMCKPTLKKIIFQKLFLTLERELVLTYTYTNRSPQIINGEQVNLFWLLKVVIHENVYVYL